MEEKSKPKSKKQVLLEGKEEGYKQKRQNFVDKEKNRSRGFDIAESKIIVPYDFSYKGILDADLFDIDDVYNSCMDNFKKIPKFNDNTIKEFKTWINKFKPVEAIVKSK